MFDDYLVRALRWQDRQLRADHEGLELHSAALPPAHWNAQREMEVFREPQLAN